MSIIKEYLTGLYNLISEIPFTLLTNIHPENRGDVALYIKGEFHLLTEANSTLKNILLPYPI